MRRYSPRLRRLLLVLLLVPATAGAQSVTAGSLRGTILSTTGEPLAGVQLTVEAVEGGRTRLLESGRDGGFAIALLAPGAYRILAEQVGFQPVRRSGVLVSAGQATSVTITLERRPPPITAATEIDEPGATAGSAIGRLLAGREIHGFDYRRDVTNLSRGITEVDAPRDGRDGFAAAAAGLRPGWNRLFVDGVPELLLRHPGVPSDPASAPIFDRDALDQVQVMSTAVDAEWRGIPGVLLGAQSRQGAKRLQVTPYATFSSAKLGGQSEQNPGDSSGTSLQLGATLTGAFVPDTAHFMIQGGYQSLQLPSANPWEQDSANYLGQRVSLRATIPSIGVDSFGTPVGRYAAPVVRTWKGGNGLGRVDWQLSDANAVMVRLGFASWTENSPLLGRDASNGSGTSLKGRDISGAFGMTTTTTSLANELRLGFSAARREWLNPAVTATQLVAEGVAIGGRPALPGFFDSKTFSVSDALQLTTGPHQLKVGADVDFTSYLQNYRYGATGSFRFGDLDGFGAAEGTYYQTVLVTGAPKFTTSEPAVFLQDTWTASPEVQVLLGLRYETQFLPKNKITLSQDWLDLSGIRNDNTPKDRRGISPRVGFVWNVQNRSEWIIRGGGGLIRSGLEASTFAEALLFDGGVTVRRGQGSFPSWPGEPSSALAPDQGPALTYFTDDYRAPRTTKGDLAISRSLGGGALLQVVGSYRHTDFLLRRIDQNRVQSSVAETQEGRPVFGTLVKQGGMLSAEPGSNRRFSGFDQVSALAPTGFSDNYEVTASLDRRVTRGLSFNASYTFSHTRDNLVGALEPDPADQLSPFPEGIGVAGWDESRSDLDIPHRVAATLEYRTAGATPVSVAARYRWRMGIPFTPGFRSGVDANGDGGGNNDPAFLDAGIPGLNEALTRASCGDALVGAFAPRNSCREESLQSLDLRLSVALPVKASGDRRVALTVDAFNVVSSKTGLVDRALVLVNPNQALGGQGTAAVTSPLFGNPRFGTLLSRRGEPRVVRIGLGIDY
ncbi:MAG TPA: carboxypeptidase regulatory-like domain-containing protein [Gemmatimonadales bacterium]|nr:carboxypeptidase regulatory-like domain-containing protein [Gemmatimonadales bacterium]